MKDKNIQCKQFQKIIQNIKYKYHKVMVGNGLHNIIKWQILDIKECKYIN